MSDVKKPVLTIAIATRNRAAYIGQTLDTIVPQLTGDVELLILDGASTDATPRIVAEYASRCPNLRYLREEANQGVDRGYDAAAELSAGEYCWLMTDDDLLLDGAVATVLAAIARRPSLIIVNSEVRNADMSRVIESRRLAIDRDMEIAAGEREALFDATASYMSFIGCVVIQRSLWLERDRQPYFGSLFVHMGVIFQKPLPGATIVLAKPFISIRYGNAMWRPQQFDVWMFKWPALIWAFDGISARVKASICAAEPWREMSRLLFYRAKGGYSSEEYRMWLEPRLRSSWEKMKSRMVLLVPGTLANLAALFFCAVVGGRGNGLRLLDLRSSRYYFRNWLRRGQ